MTVLVSCAEMVRARLTFTNMVLLHKFQILTTYFVEILCLKYVSKLCQFIRH